MIVAPLEKDLENTTFPKFMEYIPKGSYTYYPHDHKLVMHDYRTQDGKWEGRVFIGRSAHNTDNLASITASGVWWDEAGACKRDAWKKLRPRIKAMGHAGRYTFIIITTTPNGHNWLYDDIYLKWKEGNPLYQVIQWSSMDNPYFGKSNYEEERNSLSPEEFESMYNGSFTKLSGLIYPFKYENNTITHDKLPDTYDVVVGGVDFGLSSLNAVSVVGIKDGIYYILDGFEGKCNDYEDIADICHDFMIQYSVKFFYGDPEDKIGMTYLRKSGVPIRIAQKNVTEGISKVRRLIISKKLYFLDTCKVAIRETLTYSYTPNGEGSFDPKPKKGNDHILDAIRYPIYTHSYSAIDKHNITTINWVSTEGKNKLDQFTILAQTPSYWDKIEQENIENESISEFDNAWNYD